MSPRKFGSRNPTLIGRLLTKDYTDTARSSDDMLDQEIWPTEAGSDNPFSAGPTSSSFPSSAFVSTPTEGSGGRPMKQSILELSAVEKGDGSWSLANRAGCLARVLSGVKEFNAIGWAGVIVPERRSLTLALAVEILSMRTLGGAVVPMNVQSEIFHEIMGIELPTSFPRITYAEAVSRFGSFRPDLRFDLELKDVSNIFLGCSFKIFSDTKEAHQMGIIDQVLSMRKLGGAVVPMNVQSETKHSILWVTDFPMFEWNDTEQRFEIIIMIDVEKVKRGIRSFSNLESRAAAWRRFHQEFLTRGRGGRRYNKPENERRRRRRRLTEDDEDQEDDDDGGADERISNNCRSSFVCKICAKVPQFLAMPCGFLSCHQCTSANATCPLPNCSESLTYLRIYYPSTIRWNRPPQPPRVLDRNVFEE